MKSPRGTKSRASVAVMIAAGLIGGGCVAEQVRDPFTATGEVIAMSGGDAGALNACFTCHGLRGEGDGETTPRLAGLDAGYLQRQLRDYAIGLRPDSAMTPIAKALDAEDRRAVATYYATLPTTVGPPGAAPAISSVGQALFHSGDPGRGLQPCAACHGEAGEGIGAANPPLAGQPPAFLAEQMRRWADGVRRNDPRGQMLAVSRRLTPAEIEAVSGYASALRPAIAPAGAPQGPSP